MPWPAAGTFAATREGSAVTVVRPASATAFWPDAPQVLAGRDLAAGGSWMGVTRRGRFAALTNYRDPGLAGGRRSRGELPEDWESLQRELDAG